MVAAPLSVRPCLVDKDSDDTAGQADKQAENGPGTIAHLFSSRAPRRRVFARPHKCHRGGEEVSEKSVYTFKCIFKIQQFNYDV